MRHMSLQFVSHWPSEANYKITVLLFSSLNSDHVVAQVHRQEAKYHLCTRATETHIFFNKYWGKDNGFPFPEITRKNTFHYQCRHYIVYLISSGKILTNQRLCMHWVSLHQLWWQQLEMAHLWSKNKIVEITCVFWFFMSLTSLKDVMAIPQDVYQEEAPPLALVIKYFPTKLQHTSTHSYIILPHILTPYFDT